MHKDKVKGFIAGALAMTLFFAMSYSVYAIVGTKTITASYNEIKISIDQKLVTPKDVNGKVVEPFIYNGTTYLPVRAVGEAFGKPVSWDKGTNTVYIGTQPAVVYKNPVYGFDFKLPDSWRSYTIVQGEWEGIALEGSQAGTVVESGPLISIRHPLWTAEVARQDIPIMVFTYPQWDEVQKEEISLGAAPIGPTELGRNSRYVFALPARYNYAFLPGFEEVQEILDGKSLVPTQQFEQ